MTDIKRIVVKNLIKVAVIFTVLTTLVILCAQIVNTRIKAVSDSESAFVQIEQIIRENEAELHSVVEKYAQSCLNNARTIAYIIHSKPEIMGNIGELRNLAKFVEVDEIHFFDKNGKIYAGTHPEYYDMTMDDGEQISFFKPILSDKSLELCQPITPNTAEKKLIQYSALWDSEGEFIVQVGMEPIAVQTATEKNNLSYIFSLLRANPDISLYAIDVNSGTVKGCTDESCTGKSADEIGFDSDKLKEYKDAEHLRIHDIDSYCIFHNIGDTLVVRCISNSLLYHEIPVKILEVFISLVIASTILVISIAIIMNRYVIQGIYEINKKLSVITAGDMNEKVDVNTSLEFSQLSHHINEMINSILANTDTMSYVLNKTNMRIGVYEYNDNMKNVRYTEYIPKILNLSSEEASDLMSDRRKFTEYMKNLRANFIPDDNDIYKIPGDKEIYVKTEEIIKNNEKLGIIIDVTDSITTRRRIENERDVDILTGLYNRRGLENRLKTLFENPESLGYYAIVMADSDGLKNINDKYGHDKGDIYLQNVARVLSSFGSKENISARIGGDEFVVLMYNYSSEEELKENIEKLGSIQSSAEVALDGKTVVPLEFSFGYSLPDGEANYQSLLRIADKKMYENKRQRKLNKLTL